LTTSTDEAGKLVDEARRLRKYASTARSLIAVLRVSPSEVAIEHKAGFLGWLARGSKRRDAEPQWETIAGLDSIVLQDALFVVMDRFEGQARQIEDRLVVKPEEKP
jgi:hypothetical protein